MDIIIDKGCGLECAQGDGGGMVSWAVGQEGDQDI